MQTAYLAVKEGEEKMKDDIFTTFPSVEVKDVDVLRSGHVEFQDDPRAHNSAAIRYAAMPDVAAAFEGMKEGGKFPCHSPSKNGEEPLY